MAIELQSATPMFLVFDVPTSIAFYRDLLGFEIINTSKSFTTAKDDFGWCLLRLGPVELMLNNAYEDNIRPAAPDRARTQAHADTTLYLMCPALDAAYQHLLAHGLPAQPPQVSYYGLRQLHLKDPDHYSLCLQWPA